METKKYYKFSLSSGDEYFPEIEWIIASLTEEEQSKFMYASNLVQGEIELHNIRIAYPSGLEYLSEFGVTANRPSIYNVCFRTWANDAKCEELSEDVINLLKELWDGEE